MMRRRDFAAMLAATGGAALSGPVLGQPTPIRGQRPPVLIGPRDVAVMEADDTVFSPSSLSVAERRRSSDRAFEEMMRIVRGLMNRADPQAYPVSSNPSAPDARAAALARQLDDSTFNRLRPRLQRLESDPALRRRVFGERGASVNLRSPLPTVEAGGGVGGAGASGGGGIVGPLTAQPGVLSQGGLSPTFRYSTLSLQLRYLKCEDETDPDWAGSDDMVIGGLLVGADGVAANMQGLGAGEYDTGDQRDFQNRQLGSFNLRATPAYPKTFVAIWQLIEADGSDAAVAQDLRRFIFNILEALVGRPATTPANIVAFVSAAAIDLLLSLIGGLFDNEVFPPYASQLTLNSETQFGGAIRDTRTARISAHGAHYRVGYRWRLS